MKYPVLKPIMAALVVTLWLSSAPVWAARVANVVTGTVSEVNANQIIVDGQTYRVKLNGPALRQLQGVQAGQKVDLVLDGPSQAATTLVLEIHVHPESR